MNYDQANMDVCKRIAKNMIVRGFDLGDNRFLILSNDGGFGYLFNKELMAFSFEKVKIVIPKKNPPIDSSMINQENLLKLTNNLRIVNEKRKVFERLFTNSKGKTIGINNKFFGCLGVLDREDLAFYQDRSNSKGMIIAVEYTQPVMAFMPMIF